MEEGEGDATYEIQVEGDECEDVAAADADVAKDNGVAASTDKSKKPTNKPADNGDAEADEHDLVAMPSMKVVTNDLMSVNSRKCFFVHTLNTDDLDHPTVSGLLRNPSCNDVKLHFIRSSDDESTMLGMMSVTFSSSKQAATAMSAISEIRADLVVESLKPPDTIGSIVQKWKTSHSVALKPVTGEMVIVKNLDAATVTIEKLTELFPDAEDITVSSQPQSSYLGKLKGTKHAYLVFPEKELAAAVVEHANSNPLELNGRQLLVRHYTEPPKHIPEGYMRLTTRKLVLRQIAHARGLVARAQEDPTYELPAVWHARMKTATELIEKDDAARDILGLFKPSLMDFKEINLKQTLLQRDTQNILFSLGIGDDPGPSVSAGKATKRSYGVGVSEQAAKVSRGGVAKASPLLNSSRVRDLRTSFRAPLPGMMMRPMRGRGGRFGGGMGAYDGAGNFPLPSPRALAMRMRGRGMLHDYMGMGWFDL